LISQSDYPALAGKIALIARGSCTFVIKAGFAKAAGAVGTAIYNNVDGVIAGSGEGNFGIVVSIPQVEGKAYVAQIAGGATVTATISVSISSILT